MLPYIAVSRGGNWGGWSRELDLDCQYHDDDDIGDDQCDYDDDYDQYDDYDDESSLCFLGPGHRVSAESV